MPQDSKGIKSSEDFGTHRPQQRALNALQDDSTVTYLCSAGYAPDREHTINALHPARAAGLLPAWDQTRTFIDDL
jgi:dTDP-4-dehydrorhamnose 3,5-epimerase